MGTKEEPFWTTISILNTTRDRLKSMRIKRHGYGKRKTLETIEDVVVRVLDFYDENGGEDLEVLEREQASVK